MASNRPELLAPAGDWDCLRAAVLNGADAVYFGLDRFNARHRAANFKLEELPKLMAFLHSHNVKGFLTFNTLIFSDELEGAVDYLRQVAQAGVDAVIVQDLGVAELIRRMCPQLRVHGSTQMTLTEGRGIAFVRELGVTRVVLARELNVKEISRVVNDDGGGDVEVFVHGAMCVAYSGQCLTSESLGGRSANRGQCAQACRLPYDLVVDGKVKDLGDKAYLLSPSDLAAYDLIGELTEAGVASFKIEGRLKSAHYVAATCQTYRKAIDAASAGEKFEITDGGKLDLEQTFSRGFTHGFLGGVNHQELVAARFPKARGTRIGTVCGKSLRGVRVKIEEYGIKPGDGVVFDEGHPEQDEQGGRVHAVKVRGDEVELEFGVGDVNLSYINEGAIVWKTDDPAVKRRLEHSFARENVVRRVAVDFVVKAHVGELLEVVGRAEGKEVCERWEEKRLEKAEKFAVTIEMLREQLGRLGGTRFELGEVVLDGPPPGAMVPKSVMNDMRRKVCEGLERAGERKVEVREGVLEEMRGETRNATEHRRDADATLYVLVRSMEQLEAVLAHKPIGGAAAVGMVYLDFEDVRRYPAAVARCREMGMKVAIATVRVIKPGEEGLLKQVSDCRPDALLVRCLGAVGFYRETGLPLIGDYSLNVSNELTAGIFAKAGLVRLVPSYDLNWGQMAAMLRRFDVSRFEVVVHQHMPMFHMEHCVFAHTLSDGKDFRDCGRPCETHKVELADRVGEKHPLVADVGCRNTVFNAMAQSGAEYVPEMRKLGIRHFRVELLRESGAEAGRIVERYSRVVAGLEKPAETMRSLRVLNQLGVTAGTLARE